MIFLEEDPKKIGGQLEKSAFCTPEYGIQGRFRLKGLIINLMARSYEI